MKVATRAKISEVRRQEILQAAVEVIGSRGMCDTRISDIAERAGTSSALVIYYFGTKDRLLAEALTYSEERFYDQTTRELSAIEDATGRLTRLIELSCSAGGPPEQNWLDEWVLWLDMWARAPRDTEVARDREALDRRWRETIAGIVRDGVERGEFAPVDAEDFALRLGALIDGLAIQVVLSDPEVTPERMFDVCMASVSSELGFEWSGRRLAPVPGRRAKAARPTRKARPNASP